ncbi:MULTISPECIES: cytochrome c [unclassified Ruegeria]|uniref:c-type cytochrome n=1 Tax=unclassified Ruegeria TaxID=2625375 RepID=UPI0014899431|nr:MULTISPECIES: cytochrome c [unclassified Ruegeria]NOD61924.1 c-type cytochrome [Ruegeria sp. HKCCD6109]NOD74697.1 c-type cytochrome [Ruegeria sp. HKCCD4332]NOD88569.1 c-type cytochrome [Ruegeria sp. HKCCD4318]NOE12203.1 c-type cytochrome [Ruegeria sp. HKCCD4318-2]NOG09632.1 cytochrome c [Ruegeria sp. HKCCD4315]
MFKAKLGVLVLSTSLATSQAVFAQDAKIGEELYMHYCATCHGIDATGQGPMASVLVVQPSDLTSLSGEGGVFPTARVVARIDGRDPLVSHGSPMPVYGPYFDGQDTSMKTPQGQPILTSQPIVDLVAYLETLQD